MLRRIVITASTAVVLATAANAADIYRAPPPAVGFKDTPPPYVGVNWSGLYVGINGGYGWNATHDSDLVDPAGGFGGGQIGYNFQRGNIVFGIESDFQGAAISDKDAFGDKSNMNWFGTVRGRLGYAFGPTLLYGTGGFAYGNVKNGAPGFFPTTSETQTGWVAGGGVEYKFAPSWSIKTEYQFLSLDASDPNGAGPLGIGLGDRTEVHTVRAGVNYFFGGGYEPLK